MSDRTVINDRYELDEFPIGKGGMGEVWGGRDITLGREVAVKFIRPRSDAGSDDLVRRFEREARITARLVHPGVPAVYDFGVHEGRSFLVMQRVRGATVADVIAETGGPLPLGWAAAITAQTCAVLSVAHRASLVHRDLKPNNLMLEPDGGVKVLDFGLAVALDLSDFSRITQSGESVGTLPYMAPEQIEAAQSDHRTDLYALGCTLYEMLTGELLFPGATPYAVIRGQLDGWSRPFRMSRADIPAPLVDLLRDLLRRDPAQRPANADVVYERLLPFAADLGPLPGVVDRSARSSPLRMYADVLGRVLAPAPASAGPPSEEGRDDRPAARDNRAGNAGTPIGRGDLDQARSEARRLVEQSRHRQAADVLAAVVEPASRALGPLDDDVLSVRLQLAEVLFNGGDYRRAAPAYQRLAADLAQRPGVPVERALDCRRQEAACHALTGQTSLALRQLDELLRDERAEFGDDHERVVELRRQIRLLRPSAAQR
ncbi:serine/threonine-protein kinase [Plantactinospora sp. B5E13]|uniref:serine/threonine-protein kinase n=1 Tax=unclassified Plantactinospora TaxID=2631981 RepID=UPI00325F3E58